MPRSDTSDDLEIGYDNNSNGDIADAGDDMQIEDDFNSNQTSLTYDNAGNLTDDGVYKYVYDAWNRLVEVTRRPDDTTTVAAYAYDGKNRRTKKVVSNSGIEETSGDGGDTTVHYYYSNRWQILETRNGSDQATRQWVYGTQYVDEPLLMDVNLEPGTDNDCDPDNETGSESSSGTNDRRYVYHQDRNWNVVALTETADGEGGTAGAIAERYAYTPYGEFVVLAGGSAGTGGNAQLTSSVGNPFAHQGLPLDAEKLSYQNRWREYAGGLQRFVQPGSASPTRTRACRVRRPAGQPPGVTDSRGLCERGTTRTATFTEKCPEEPDKSRKCTGCLYCSCGGQFASIGNEWTMYGSYCGGCEECGPLPEPTGSCGAAPTPPPIDCCKYWNNPTESTCLDCCLALADVAVPPPYWELFIQKCAENCNDPDLPPGY